MHLSRICPFSHGAKLFNTRGFSNRSYPVGPAPEIPLVKGDEGYEYFADNLEFFRRHGRMTLLSPEQSGHILSQPQQVLSQPQQELKVIAERLSSIQNTEERLVEEVKQLSSKVEKMLETNQNLLSQKVEH